MPSKTFSPKELAAVIGVSTSSIKRWADAGLIETSRTAGGHRRIRMHDALRFIRSQEMDVLRPDLLGLAGVAELPPEARTGALTEDALFAVLTSEDPGQARGLLTAAYLDGADLGALFDGPVRGALNRLGTIWRDDERGIYLEHVATDVCVEALNEIRRLTPPPPDDAPVALGGAPSGDPYLMPSLMAAATLADAGYAVVNLGPDTPAAAFLHAAEVHAPSLVWLSITALLNDAGRAVLTTDLIPSLQARGASVVLGGQGIGADAAWPASVRMPASMAALATLARAHRSGAPA